MSNVRTPAKSNEVKGVPGFSARLDKLFDYAGVPSDTRLSWGAKRWGVVPNTVRNWIKLDTPPANHSTLLLVLSDLLQMFNCSVDKTLVVGWLYAGGKNPFEVGNGLNSPPINHILQIKIFNRAYTQCSKIGVDLNSVSEAVVNDLINSAYLASVNSSASGEHAIDAILNELIARKFSRSKID
ncbi:MAG: hypothetical protein EOO52_13545 [Gammaproteobacteria bacterium]|nr:MAG: hypothetical protein EOO52_13545 [Gammaproteobacteria bacterium]